jgi:chromosome segregation protein
MATNPDVPLPRGAAWASDLVTGPAGIVDTVRAALSGVAVVDDLAAARALVAAHAGVTAVTRRGDVLSLRRASGGSGDAPSILHVQAAFDEACERRDAASRAVETTTFGIRAAEQRESDTHEVHDGALERLHESDAQMAAVAEHLGQLGAASRAARDEADRLRERLEAAQDRIRAEQEELGGLSQRLGAAQAEPEQTEADTQLAQGQRDAHAEAAVLARAGETEARLALRTSEERARALSARAESLQFAAEAERDARARAEESAQKRSRQAQAAREVLAGARFALERIDASVQGADDARTAVESERLERAVQLAEVRRGVDEYGAEYARLTDDAHKDEVARAEQRIRLEQFQQRAIDELGLDPQVLVDEYGPHLAVPPEGESDLASPYVREEQERRLRRAERGLMQLGRVNPLALEEFAALEERHAFLGEQLADIKKSRADLMEIVKEIDDRVETIFAEAFADTARAFEEVFPRLFPGGEGRLVLTDPTDMLMTGIDVEARPAGKKVKRLSLLSGGERSLAAIGMLIAIFKARPSPFYVMDEVEAALDEVNLGRLLDILQELQSDSQLIIITHQKRTMEIADALYGATMRGDGVTTIISQRLRESEPG